MPGPTLAACQLTSTDDVAANLDRCETLVRASVEAGADIVGLPENFAYLGSDRDHRLSIAEKVVHGDAPGAGPILSAMQRLARQTRAWL